MTSSPVLRGEELTVLIQYQLVTALQEREHDLAEAQRVAHVGSWTRDVGTGASSWSDELYRLLQVDPSEPASFETVIARMLPEDRESVRTAMNVAEAELTAFTFEFRVAQDVGLRWLRARGAVTAMPDGGKRSNGTLQDVTEAVRAAQSLELLTRQCAALSLHAPDDCVTLWTADGTRLFSSGRDLTLLAGWADPDGLTTQRVHPADRRRLGVEKERLHSSPGQSIQVSYRVADSDGAWRTVEARGVNALDDPVIKGICVSVRETAPQPGDASAGEAPEHEPLTLAGIAGHAELLALAHAAVVRARRLDWRTAIVILDIDDFHDVNRRWGDAAGDLVLTRLAERLTQTFRMSDAVGRSAQYSRRPHNLVARLGGDRFIAICENVPDADAGHALADRVQSVSREPIALPNGDQASVSLGIGIAITGPSGRSVEDRLRDAESALRSAKEAGRGRHVVLAEDASTEHELRQLAVQALQRGLDNAEFVLHYQPKLSLESDRITGVEALLRWQDPQRGLVPPLEFIPLAEQTGLIVPIGAWVIEQACMQAAAWHRRFPRQPPLVMAVNVSGPQFGPDLLGVVTAALRRTGALPSHLCLEVTESILIADAAATDTLSALSALGVRLAIDDFGTGFSSLAYLKRFPLHELKIDKTFVDGLGRDDDDTAIIGATVAMAHALGLSVIAEGVENADQLDRLRVIGCQEAQGFHIARPQPAAQITQLLAAEETVGWRAAARPVPVAEAPQFRPARVLVVDDADDVRQLAQMSLTAAGFDVTEAPSGPEALAMAQQLRPDCVILDVTMPGMSGLDVCRRLRADPATASCTILMLTGKASADDKIEAFSGGADDYIVKPFSPRDLVARVHSALRRSSDAASP